jgi:hypothetical protein
VEPPRTEPEEELLDEFILDVPAPGSYVIRRYAPGDDPAASSSTLTRAAWDDAVVTITPEHVVALAAALKVIF